MAKKLKKYKVGCDSETYAISLVESPAIESEFVALEKQEQKQVFLESNERHMIYGAALIPDMDIYRNDGENEYYISFSKESISKMSQDFMREYRQHEVKTDHEDIANEVFVTESWIVEDSYKDKSNALGISVPEGTWMVAMKVNNIETWERIKAGELNGFSVESLVSLEEFSKQNDNNMEIKDNEMFWDKLKNILKETFSKKEEDVVDEPHVIEPTNVDLEENNPEQVSEPVVEPQEAPKVEEPVTTPEPTPDAASATQNATHSEPIQEPQNEPVAEEPKQDNHLEELVNSLKEEIKALKDMNTGLQEKIKDLGKQPSAVPINTNAKPGGANTAGVSNPSYQAWRKQMASYLGY